MANAGGGGTTWRGLTSVALLAIAAPSRAQTAASPTPASVPGSHIAPTRQQVDPIGPTGTANRSVDFTARTLPIPDCPLKDSPLRIRLASVRFEAARGGELAPVIARLLAPLAEEVVAGAAGATGTTGTERPISDVCDIQYRANAALYAAGYVASVQVPSQEVADGVLRLSVVTARVVEVRITGVEKKTERLLARAEAIRAMDPLNQREVEHMLLLANDTPGQQLRLSLEPAGKAPGDVIVTINVASTRGQLLVNYSNAGSQQLGPSLLSLRGELYGLIGLDDIAFVGVSNSTDLNEVHVVQGGYEVGLGNDGIRLGGRASYALSNPTLPGLDLRSTSLIASLDLVVPVYRGLVRTGAMADDVRLWIGAGIEILNQRTVLRVAGADAPFTRDRLRVPYLRAGGHVTGLRSQGAPAFDIDVLLELRRGISILQATRLGVVQDGFEPTRLEGDPQAFEARGTIDATVRPFPAIDWLSFDLSAFGQWANKPLLNLEEFSIGNLTYGRGYDPGANAGDHALALRIQPVVRITKLGQDPQLDIDGFYDGVRLWNLDTGSTEANRLLQSVGGGVRLRTSRGVQLDVQYAHPLDRALSTDARPPRDRVLVSLTARFLPWRFGR